MNVLILSCNTGGGHNTAAKALYGEFEKRGIDVRIKDAMDFVPKPKRDIVEKGHGFLYRHAPKMFGKAYEKTEQMDKHAALYFDYAQHALSASKYIRRYRYDTVICVHEFPALMLTAARKYLGLDIELYFVATDYSFAPGLEETFMDAWFVPHGFKEVFKEKGLPENRIAETGIPVNSACYERRRKADVRRSLCVRDDRELILIAAGSIGCGPIKEIVEEMRRRKGSDAIIAVLCGKNRTLLKKLSAEVKDASLIPMGFVDNVIDWLFASDVFISKAGGLSTTEAATVGIPVILMNAIPGLEIHNLDYFVGNGCACTAETVQEICEAADMAVNNVDRYISNQRRLFSVNSVRMIADYTVSRHEEN